MLRTLDSVWAAEKARLRRGLSRSLLDTAVGLFAALAALEGLALVLAGAYISLSRHAPPWVAGLVVGGLAMLAAGLALAWVARDARGGGQPPAPALAASEPAPELGAPSLLGAAAAELAGKVNIKARDVALAALVAGVALGFSPKLREQVFGQGPRRRHEPFSRH